jgi:transposase
MLCVGIDWAAESHTVTLLARPGEVLESLVIANTFQGFLRLLDAIRRHMGKDKPALAPGEVLFVIEDRNQRLVDFLLAQDFMGYLMEPNRMTGYRLRYCSSGNKTDPDDAFMMADVLFRDRDQLPPISPMNTEVQALKTLLVDREGFVRDQTRLTNRLTACLRQYYPEAPRLFRDVASKTALEFLAAYPDFAAAHELSRQQVRQFLADHHCNRPKQLERILAVLAQEPIVVPAVVVRTKRQQALHLIQQLRAVQATVAEYDKEIQRIGAENEEVQRFKGLPGAGPQIAGGLYTLMGDDRARFRSATALQSFVGTAPRTIQSGKMRAVCFRFGCNRFYRTLAQQMALGALHASTWAKQYYRGKRAEGKRHQHALRCLANLLLKIAFAIWRDRATYNENRHLAQIMRHHMRQTSKLSLT